MTTEIENYKNDGFTGFIPVAELRNRLSMLPECPGAYIVVRDTDAAPMFLSKGTGGFFKGEDPNVDIATLEANYVQDSRIVYIGKATSLKNRVGQLLKFGAGKNIAHKGGRYLWQLADAEQLLVAWKPTPESDSREVEKQMIQEFKALHGGMRPFANLVD